MDKKLEDILNEALAPELKEQIQEAFDSKVEALRNELEDQVRDELSSRFEHDKNQIVEAMDKMLSDVIRVHEETKANEIIKLKEARKSVKESYVNARIAFKAQLSSLAENSGKIINENLSREIKALQSERIALANKADELAEGVDEVKATLAENHARHLDRINNFVTSQITKELKEFDEDKRALVETRMKLISESKQKLAETQKAFIKESAKKVEKMVNSSLKREMTQLHEDLELQRQNSFGRKIFEAVAAEFQTSYLAEGTEMRKLQKIIENKNLELASKSIELSESTKKINAAAQAKEAAERKFQLAESRAERTTIMSELMSNLRGDKRAVMESMLETTKTNQLRTAFERLLPVVLNESSRKVAPTGKKVLSESEKTQSSTTITGNRRDMFNLRSEEKIQNNEENADIIRLAGIRK